MEKVLHVTIQGILGDNDPEQAVVATSVRVMQTGQNVIKDGPEITVNLKQAGAYKQAGTLNAEVLTQVESFINSQYGVSGFDKVHLIGGFGTL